MRKTRLLLLLLTAALPMMQASAQTFDFDMTQEQPTYTDETGYGYDVLSAPDLKDKKSTQPFYFSVKVPDGNYRVSVVLGSKKKAANTTVRAESRRLFVEPVSTKKGEFLTYEFVVNKRSPEISGPLKDSGKEAPARVKIKDREKDYLNWDGKLTLEFNGDAPAVKSIHIERDDTCPTIYLCGNSTVTDQNGEPWASWGQMITRWFGPSAAISNHAESGLTAGTFLGSNRLDKILTTIKEGDYVLCEFGHNDEKEKSYGDGPWYNYSRNLKIFVDRVRKAGGHIIFITPTQRRRFDDNKKYIVDTHGDYPAAMKAVAEREKVPVIDLHQMTKQLFEAAGYEGSTKMLVHYPANTFEGQEKALADNTHFNQYGAYEVAKCVVMGMKKLELPLVENLRAEWQDFDPSQPDATDSFKWPLARKADLVKPDGN